MAAWESPDSGQLPTVRQAQSLARAYRVPFTLLYLDGPTPDLEHETVPEFRRLDPETGNTRPQSRQLRWMIRQAQERQAFAIELLEDDGEVTLPWVGSASLNEDPESLGLRIREELGVNDHAPGVRNKELVLDWWIERVETLGAFVSRYWPDGNQHWVVEPSEARGLSFCHPLAPFIILNSRDAPSGRTFTLMHELAHIYYGKCGVDDLGDERQIPLGVRALEQRCNQVAAAILMPAIPFRQRWGDRVEEVSDRIRNVADLFGVSRQAAAVRARSRVLGLISEGQYNDILGYLSDEYREFKDSRPSGGGGGIAPQIRVLKELGEKYSRLVFGAYADGKMSRLEVAEALDARLGDIESIRNRL